MLSVDTVGGALFDIPSEVPKDVIEVNYSSGAKENTNEIRYWNQFASYETLASSFMTLPHSENSVEGTFDYYQQGTEGFHKEWNGFDSMEDKMRRLMENSGSPQGFQIIADMGNGFSGLCAETVQYIREEYRKHVLVFGVAEPSDLERGEGGKVMLSLSRLNQALALGTLKEYSATYIPLFTPKNPISSLSRANFDDIYHQSAYLSTSIEAITTSLRLRRRIGLDGLCSQEPLGLGMSIANSELHSLTTLQSLQVCCCLRRI
jgi:hypothetical protein